MVIPTAAFTVKEPLPVANVMLPVVFERVALAVLEAIFTTEPAAKLEVVPAVPLIVIAPVADAVKLPPAVRRNSSIESSSSRICSSRKETGGRERCSS